MQGNKAIVMDHSVEAPPVWAVHPLGRRLWRTVQLAAIRCLGDGQVVDANAAPFSLTFKGRAADVIARHIYRFGCHEPVLTRYVLSHIRLRGGDVALDVGANIGWYSLLLDRLAQPGADIFAFEPDPENYGFLLENLRVNAARHVTAIDAAAGDTPGTMTLNRYKRSNGGRHTLVPGGNTSGGTVPVRVTTLSQFWEERGLADRPLRFLKIDVEGYEYFVLKGAQQLLQRCACVSLEFSASGMRSCGLDPGPVIDLIEDAGFEVRRWSGDLLAPVDLRSLRDAEGQFDLLLSRE
jgi:FkbM family methyltransferase